ncbi:MAG: winged helix-turn-helix transcriptional regulator [Alphaproteobacteria bacterium]|nr:winged helix-turn-helix transcriptional regulator [Alphaproteobacteria bacterium]
MPPRKNVEARPPRTGPPVVDFGKLPGYVGYQVRQAQTAIFRDFERITSETGATPGEFSLLTVVNANPGINQISLVRAYRLDKSTLSHSIKRLARRGLIRRRRDPADRRYYGLWLTASGHKVLKRVTKHVEVQECGMAAALKPAEREQLLRLLQKISLAFD